MTCPVADIYTVMRLINESKVNAVIAGGAAASPKLANDIDVYVFGSKAEALILARHINEHHHESLRRYYEQSQGHVPSWWSDDVLLLLNEDSFVKIEYGKDNVEVISLDLEVGGAFARGVQVIIAPEASVDALLLNFDLSCHMWALVGSVANRIGCSLSTEVDEPIVICCFTSPWTLKRAEKLAERYGVGIANLEEAQTKFEALLQVVEEESVKDAE